MKAREHRRTVWLRLRSFLFYESSHECEDREELETALLVACFGSFCLLMAVAVASGQLPVRQFLTTAGEAFLSWPYEVQLSAVFVVPFVMYWVKRRWPSVYGSTEAVLGGLFAFLALYLLLQEPTVSTWVALFTSMYWMSRGVQNLTEGIVAYKIKPKRNKDAPAASVPSSAGSEKCITGTTGARKSRRRRKR